MNFEIYIGSDRLDLFKEENVVVNSSIVDVKDIDKISTDYTLSFTVPASENNNRVFKHYYNANVDNGFDARTSKSGRIELGGIPFKEGFFNLNKVKVVNGNPSSYDINFVGKLLDLKEKLGEDKLSDIDLSQYTHTYNSANVKQGLEYSMFNSSVVYPMIAFKRYYYNSSPSDNTQTETVANIALGGGADTGVVWDDLRPAIRVKELINRIEDTYGLEFQSDFFNQLEFANIFLWLNPKKDVKIGGGSYKVDFDSGSNAYMNLTTNIGTYPAKNGNTLTSWRFQLGLTISPSDVGTVYYISMYKDGVLHSKYRNDGAGGNFAFFYNPTDINEVVDIYFEISSDSKLTYSASLNQVQRTLNPLVEYVNITNYASLNTSLSQIDFSKIIPDMKIIDFLKGIFNMFNMVVIPKEDNVFKVIPIDEFYEEGVVVDLTKNTQLNEYEVRRGDLFGEISYEFEDPKTILNLQFEKNTGSYYGNEKTVIYDSQGKKVSGENYSYKIPFEVILLERLIDQNDSLDTQIQYGAAIDEDLKPVDLKAHLFYNVNRNISTKHVAFIEDDGGRTVIDDRINIPSHTNRIGVYENALLFSEEFSTWDGELLSKNLYYNFHKKQIENLFNVKARKFSYKLKNVSINTFTTLNLNDKIKINNDYYHIIDYSLNLTTGDANINLINII